MQFVYFEPTETLFPFSKPKQSSQKLKSANSRFNYLYILHERKSKVRPVRGKIRSVRGEGGGQMY